jgi:hypothetical protein
MQGLSVGIGFNREILMIFYVFYIGMANSLTQMLLPESDAKNEQIILSTISVKSLK